jgi:hypothetical protein
MIGGICQYPHLRIRQRRKMFDKLSRYTAGPGRSVNVA